LSALSTILTGLPEESFYAFNNVGIGINILFLIASTLWVVHLAKKLSLKFHSIFVISLLTATMPTMLIHSTLWHLWYPLGVLAVPVALAIYSIVIQPQKSKLPLFLSFFALGFISANLFIGMILVVAGVAGLILAYRFGDSDDFTEYLGGYLPPSNIAKVALVIVQLLFYVNIGMMLSIYSPCFAGFYTNYFPIGGKIFGVFGVCFISLLLLLFSYYLARKSILIKFFQHSIFLPFLTGWAVGVNIMFRYWGASAVCSIRFKGYAVDASISFMEKLAKITVVPFFLQSIWHWILLVIVFIILLASWQAIVQSKLKRREAVFVAAFCLVAVILNTLIAADITLRQYTPGEASIGFGYISRYYIFMVSVFAVAFTWAQRSKIHLLIKSSLIGIAVLIGLTSFYQYSVFLLEEVQTRNFANNQISDLVNDYFQENPDGIVVCARTVLPEVCSVLYGYNVLNYVADGRSTDLTKTSTRAGRIRYANFGSTIDDDDYVFISKLFDEVSGEILIITEIDSTQLPSNAVILWGHPAVEVSVWLVRPFNSLYPTRNILP